jgi:hypothetical protein
MKRLSSVLVMVFVMCVGVSAGAQDAPPEPPVADEATDSDAEEADRKAWTLLERALDALAQRDEAAARRYLEKLHAEYPEHPAAKVSENALETLGGQRSSSFLGGPAEDQQPSTRPRAGGERPSGTARAELAVFQTINGLAVAAELCGVAECEDPRLVIGGLAGGAGLGLGLSLYATRDGITPGQALALNSGTFWGFANGLAIHGALEQQSFNPRRLPGLLAGGQLLGLGASQLLYMNFRPDAGDVALMNTAGFWAGTFALLINGIAETQEIQAVALSTMAAFNVGLLGGGILSKYYPMSRGRAFVIDAGGLVGSLTGVGAYLFFTGGDGGPQGGFTSAVIGGVAGLGLSTYLTRKWDADESLFGDMQLMLAPTGDGGATVGVGRRF